MKQAWNELFNYQANNPLSFQFSVFKSSDIHPSRRRQLEIRKSKQQESALSLCTRLWNDSWASLMTSRIQRMCLQACSVFMKSSVDSVFITEQDVPEVYNGPVFTWTVGQPSSPGTVVAGATFVSALCPDVGVADAIHVVVSWPPHLSPDLYLNSQLFRRRLGVGTSRALGLERLDKA